MGDPGEWKPEPRLPERNVSGVHSREKLARRVRGLELTLRGLLHEWRNALQEIQACVGLARLDADNLSEALESFDGIDRVVKRLRGLHEDAVFCALPLQLEKQPCDIQACWRKGFGHARESREAWHWELNEEVVTEALQVNGDPKQLEVAFSRVFAYCLAQGSSVPCVALSCSSLKARESSVLCMRIRCGGRPARAKDMRRSLEPSYESRTGLGRLDLLVAQRCIEAHKGRLELKVDKSGGPQIVLLLPGA